MEKIIIILIIIVIIIYLINMNSKSNELELFEDTNSLLDQNTNDLISLYKEFNDFEESVKSRPTNIQKISYLKQGYRGKIGPLIDKNIDILDNHYLGRYFWSGEIKYLRNLSKIEIELINKRNQYLQN